jgi:hypothetical protein
MARFSLVHRGFALLTPPRITPTSKKNPVDITHSADC